MRLIDFSFNRPTENLAFDEVLLDGAENGKAGECLRFWESPMPFVVLGVSQVCREEVWDKNCEEDHIRILRRASGGGCVLQGPGCLNYALVMSHAARPELQTIRGSYCYILDRLCAAFKEEGVLLHHKGVSDLALSGKKVSGSAQKRRRRFILHHGTFLYNVDFDAMERYLREPEDRPQYRGPRDHRGFVCALHLSADRIRSIVAKAFEVPIKLSNPTSHELEVVAELAHEKYANPDWIFRR